MNNSFEQLYKKNYNSKELPNKNVLISSNVLKKQQKTNPISKNKNTTYPTNPKPASQIYHYSMISNNSIEKNLNNLNTSKSNHKRSKRQDSANSKNKINSFLKKCPTIQLTKKQKDIREAIEYRFQKSKMKSYLLCCAESKIQQLEDLKARQIIDFEEEQKFNELYGYLNELKVVNLYEYNKYKEETLMQKREKSNNKIIVIKNSKKKRQNSDTIITFNENKDEELKKAHLINKKLLLNSNNSQYFSNNPTYIQSQRNHTETSVSHHQRNRSQSPGQNFKMQFPSSKVFQKQKSGSKSKIKIQNSIGLNQKMIVSSSVQKNFKSIKDIYLNAISSLANKNTVKTNHKLFKAESELKNKASKSLLYQSDKKSYKNEYQSTRPDKNHSSSALHQNYFSCISSRENKKEEKSSCYRKTTKQKLDKTLLISEVNPHQWKSIIMKVDDSNKFQSKEIAENHDNRKFKLKLKDSGFQKIGKNLISSSNGKSLAYPNSYRENTKSPKLKKYIVNEDEENVKKKKGEKQKMVNSVKNLCNQSCQSILNSSSGVSKYFQTGTSFKKAKK